MATHVFFSMFKFIYDLNIVFSRNPVSSLKPIFPGWGVCYARGAAVAERGEGGGVTKGKGKQQKRQRCQIGTNIYRSG